MGVEADDVGRRWLRRIVTIGWLTFAIASVVALGDSYLNRNPDYACILLRAQHEAVKPEIDSDLLDNTRGSWDLWPTGLTCTYIADSGGTIDVGPPPVFSVLTALGGLGLVSAIGSHIALASKRTSRPGTRIQQRIEGESAGRSDRQVSAQ